MIIYELQFILESLMLSSYSKLDNKFKKCLEKDLIREARKISNHIYARNKDKYEEQLVYAIILMADGELKEALGLVRKGISHIPQKSPYLISYKLLEAELLLHQDSDLETIIEILLSVKNTQNLNPKQALFAAYLFQELEREDVAIHLVETYVNNFPTYETHGSYLLLGSFLLELEDDGLQKPKSLAEFHFKRAEILNDPSVYQEVADYFILNENIEQAILILKKGIGKLKNRKDHIPLYDILFDALLDDEQWSEALKYCEKKVTNQKYILDESYVSPYDISVSKEEIDYYQTNEIDYALSLVQLANYQRELGYCEEAFQSYQKAILCKGGQNGTHIGISKVGLTQGDPALALKYAQEATHLHPHSLDAWECLIRAHIANYDLNRAKQCIKEAIHFLGEDEEETLSLHIYIAEWEKGNSEAKKHILNLFYEDDYHIDTILSLLHHEYFLCNPETMARLKEYLEEEALEPTLQTYIDFYYLLARLTRGMNETLRQEMEVMLGESYAEALTDLDAYFEYPLIKFKYLSNLSKEDSNKLKDVIYHMSCEEF